MPLKPYLQLVRLPNLFTAAADPLAGWIVATGSLTAPERWGALMAASVLIYAGGIVLNDVFDVAIDRAERPNRPLPSGRVPLRPVAKFGGLALLSGPLVAWFAGPTAGVVAAALALCVLLYDGGLKRTLVGPVVMGACRSLNLLLGFCAIADLGGPYAWTLAGCVGLFVVGVTVISRSEVAAGSNRGIIAGTTIEFLALVGLLAVAVGLFRLLDQSLRFPLVGFVLFLMLFQVLGRVGWAAIQDSTPARVQRAVKTGVLSLVWLDVAVAATVRDPWYALAIAALWVPAFVIGRWLYTT